MVLAWTIADVRYRFRVRTAPIPLQGVTFSVVTAVGFLSLLTDLWRAEQWLVPKGNILTPASWQALLGALFLFTFLTWAWFAFIRPPTYGRRNAQRFARTLYRFILKGSPAELAVIADEITPSARTLVRYATDRSKQEDYGLKREGEQPRKPPKVEAYANDLLLLVADKRLCRAIVESSPGTALAIFQEMRDAKKYDIQVEIFARNIVNEALANRDSFIFHEAEGYDSGLIGYHKPLTQTMFSDYSMVETIGTLFDPDPDIFWWGKSKWNAAQWEAYCRVVLMTFRDYVDKNIQTRSFVFGSCTERWVTSSTLHPTFTSSTESPTSHGMTTCCPGFKSSSSSLKMQWRFSTRRVSRITCNCAAGRKPAVWAVGKSMTVSPA